MSPHSLLLRKLSERHRMPESDLVIEVARSSPYGWETVHAALKHEMRRAYAILT